MFSIVATAGKGDGSWPERPNRCGFGLYYTDSAEFRRRGNEGTIKCMLMVLCVINCIHLICVYAVCSMNDSSHSFTNAFLSLFFVLLLYRYVLTSLLHTILQYLQTLIVCFKEIFKPVAVSRALSEELALFACLCSVDLSRKCEKYWDVYRIQRHLSCMHMYCMYVRMLRVCCCWTSDIVSVACWAYWKGS